MRKLITNLSLLAACLCAGMPVSTAEEAAGAQASGTITEASDGDAPSASSEDAPPAEYRWQAGPRSIALLDQASIKLPADYTYLAGTQAQQLLRQFGNPNVADVVGVISGPGKDWLIVVRFGKVGFVQDGDTADWDIDGLLESIKKGVENTNAARVESGAEEVEVLGWLQAPSYDAATRRLTWGIATRNKDDAAEEAQAINYTAFALGRDGYVSLNLVSGLVNLERNRAHAETIAGAFDFVEGKRYADFDADNDELAKFDLFGLISNAAAAANPDAGPPPEEGGKRMLWIILGVVLAALILVLAAWFLLMRGDDDNVPVLTDANAGSA